MKRILIAEEEESIVASLQFLMQSCGYATRSALDGDQALKAVAEFAPHLVLLDVMLPLKSGLEVCRAIRSDPARRGTRVLMLTAKGGAGEIALGLSAGADEYLIKPFSTHHLIERVKALLDDPVPGSRLPEEDG